MSERITSLFHFNYAIRFPNGTYYIGFFNDTADIHIGVASIEIIRKSKQHSYTFTEKGAYTTIANNAERFKGCVVERVV
jgi:hypothetical protein